MTEGECKAANEERADALAYLRDYAASVRHEIKAGTMPANPFLLVASVLEDMAKDIEAGEHIGMAAAVAAKRTPGTLEEGSPS